MTNLRSATSLIALGLFATTSEAFTPSSSSLTSCRLQQQHLHKQQQRRTHWNLPTLTASSASAAAESSVIVKRLENSAVEVVIPVPGTATRAAYDKVANELSKTVSIPGFRKGSKIPPQVLEQVMSAKGGKNALKVQAINDLIAQLVEPTLKEESLEPIGQATLIKPAEELAENYVPGQPMELHVKCDVWPEIKWAAAADANEKPYVGLKAKYSRKPFNQERLDKALSDLKERYASLEAIEDPSHALQLGDACVVQMDGYMATPDGSKGEPLPNAASGDRVEVILGPGRYMDGLVEGLVGAKVGDTVTVKVSFPEKLRDKTLAGKPAIFDVQVLEASKRMVPEVTDDFANKVRAGLTAEALMAELRKAIDNEDAKEFVPDRNKALGAALAQVFDVDVPDTLVTNQAREKYAVMMADMRDNGVDDEVIKNQITPENFLKYKNIVKESIERDFKISMATDEIARLENINIPAYQVEEQMESIRKDAAEQKEELDENMIRAKVETTLQRQAVMEWLAERAELEVEYKDDDQFDPALMQQIAEESLNREKELLGADVDVEALAEGKTEIAAEEAMEVPTEPVIESVAAVETVASEAAEESPAPVESAPSPSTEESEEDEAARQARYAAMSLEERAYQILKDLGTL